MRVALLRRKRRRTRKKLIIRILSAATVALFFLLLLIYEKLLDGKVAAPAMNLCASRIEQAISSAADGADWSSVSTAENGSFRVDPALLNEATERLLSALEKEKKLKVKIPLGSLTNKQFLSGKGPGVTARVFCDYRAECAVRSEIGTVGINQTLYTVKLDVKVDGTLFLKDKRETVTVTDTLIVDQRLYIGGVPLSGKNGG